MARGSSGRQDQIPDTTEAVILLPRAVYTVAYASPILVNGGGSQLIVYLVMWTAGSASLTLSVADIAPGDLVATNLLSSAAISSNGTTRLRISPHLTAAANTIAREIVPARFQISIAVANANPAELSLSYSLT
jgi:hypothetical protein